MKNRTNPALWYVECAVTAELHLLLFFILFIDYSFKQITSRCAYIRSPYRPSASIGRYFLHRYIFRNGS